MQPLDVAVYGPLKKYFEQELNSFQEMHPDRIVNQYDMAKLFGGAYATITSIQNAVDGCKKTRNVVYIYRPLRPKCIWKRRLPLTMTVCPFHDSSLAPSKLLFNIHQSTIADTLYNGTSSTKVAPTARQPTALHTISNGTPAVKTIEAILES